MFRVQPHTPKFLTNKRVDATHAASDDPCGRKAGNTRLTQTCYKNRLQRVLILQCSWVLTCKGLLKKRTSHLHASDAVWSEGTVLLTPACCLRGAGTRTLGCGRGSQQGECPTALLRVVLKCSLMAYRRQSSSFDNLRSRRMSLWGHGKSTFKSERYCSSVTECKVHEPITSVRKISISQLAWCEFRPPTKMLATHPAVAICLKPFRSHKGLHGLIFRTQLSKGTCSERCNY